MNVEIEGILRNDGSWWGVGGHKQGKSHEVQFIISRRAMYEICCI